MTKHPKPPGQETQRAAKTRTVSLLVLGLSLMLLHPQTSFSGADDEVGDGTGTATFEQSFEPTDDTTVQPTSPTSANGVDANAGVESESDRGNPEPKKPAKAELSELQKKVRAYSASSGVAAAIRAGKRRAGSFRNSNGKRGGMCYKGVKTALAASGLTSHYMTGNSAVGAYNGFSYTGRGRHIHIASTHEETLKKFGFVNLLDYAEYKDRLSDPYNAPKGAVLVYSGGNMHGHIEIKIGEAGSGEVVSDLHSYHPRTGHEKSIGSGVGRRTLVGVYVKI